MFIKVFSADAMKKGLVTMDVARDVSKKDVSIRT